MEVTFIKSSKLSIIALAPAHVLNQQTQKCNGEDLPLIRKADVENHNKDGGMWVVIRGKVYDVQDFRLNAPSGTEAFTNFLSQDVTKAFEDASQSNVAAQFLQRYVVGYYADPSSEVVQVIAD